MTLLSLVTVVVLPAAVLTNDVVAVVAGLGYGLVMPITPCDGLAAGLAAFRVFLI